MKNRKRLTMVHLFYKLLYIYTCSSLYSYVLYEKINAFEQVFLVRMYSKWQVFILKFISNIFRTIEILIIRVEFVYECTDQE